jgi:hypothetical protein
MQLQASGTGGSAATTTTKIAICDVTGKSSTMAQQVNIPANGRPQQRLNLGPVHEPSYGWHPGMRPG